jgi:putative C-S lyase
LQYDYQTVTPREETGAVKWTMMRRDCPDVAPGVVPMSVADMEFKTAPEIARGLAQFVGEAIFGYTAPTGAYYDAVCGWMKRRHGWEIDREWIVTFPGVVGAFYAAVRALTREGEGVIVMPPVYYPFYSAVTQAGRRLEPVPLHADGMRYTVDFPALERCAAKPDVKVLLFCSPHNPVGRVWSPQELARVAEICAVHGVVVISDEIHADLMMSGHRHTVFAAVSKQAEQNCIVCTAPSKTFNLAGLQTSNIFIPSPALREAFTKEVARTASGGCNCVGYRACELAYTRGEAWLEGALAVIDSNRDLVRRTLASRLPAVRAGEMEGTYLLWLDFRALGLPYRELERRCRKAQVFFDEGYLFGDEGRGFERMNLACPSRAVEEALGRLCAAFANLPENG